MVRNANESYYDLQAAMKALQEKQMGQTHEQQPSVLRDSNRHPVEAPRREET